MIKKSDGLAVFVNCFFAFILKIFIGNTQNPFKIADVILVSVKFDLCLIAQTAVCLLSSN